MPIYSDTMYVSLEDKVREALHLAVRQNEEISRIGKQAALESLRVAKKRMEGSERLASALDRFEALCYELGELCPRSQMKVIRCTGKPKIPRFDLRTLNGHLIR